MKLITFNGSPREGSSIEILIDHFQQGFKSILPKCEIVTVKLNDLEIIPCQSCGLDPSPLPCIFKDDLYPYLEHLATADMVLVASPIYFDSVSAQTKLFIDRTNCFRSPIIKGAEMEFDQPRLHDVYGACILVGGDRQKYDLAERVIGGMFVWCGITKIGKLVYSHSIPGLGSVAQEKNILQTAFDLGSESALKLTDREKDKKAQG